MGQSIGWCVGSCLNGCVNMSTYLHDKYNDWRYGDDDYSYWAEVPTAKVGQYTGAISDIHSAVLNRSTEDVVRILQQQPDAALQLNCSGETPLHAACKLGHLHVIRVLLEHISVSDVRSDVGSPLHSTLQSVRAGYMSVANGVLVVRALVAKGCHTDWTDRQGKTAVFLAAEHGAVDCLQALSDLGADLNLREHNKFSPLYIATIRGDLDCVHALLAQSSVEVDSSDSMNRTPLMAALITILNNLRYEKMPNDVDDTQWSSIDQGRQNKVAIVEALLHSGANPNAVDYQGRTALTLAFLILELDHIRTSVFANFNVFSPAETPKKGDEEEVESSYCILVRLLLQHGGITPDDWVKDYSKAPVWLQEAYEQAKCWPLEHSLPRPSSLRHITRYHIRHYLALQLNLHRIADLPLPGPLLSYLHIKYI